MPQLDIFIFQNITLYSSIAFLILSYIFYSYILPKILISLKTRHQVLKNLQNIKTEEQAEITQNKNDSIIKALSEVTKEIEIRNQTTLTIYNKNND
jgi:F0F1-type ATP synthase membrane subunit b/b'